MRPFRSTDIEPLARLLQAARAWPPTAAPTPDDIRLRWQRRNVHPDYDVSVLPGPAGELMAFSQNVLFRDGTPRLALEIAVHPDYRCGGIGSALYNIVQAHAESVNVSHLTAPVYSAVVERRPESAEFLERRGFRADHSYWQLRLDHIAEQAQPQWPQGIGVRRFDYGNVDIDAQTWSKLIIEAFGESATAQGVKAQLSEPGVSSNGYFFAVDEATGREIGMSRGRIDSLGGRQIGYIGTVGVLPEYRGRGVAEALIKQTLAYLANQGIESATLFVEDNNMPARRLYDKLGWSPVYKTDHYWKRFGT